MSDWAPLYPCHSQVECVIQFIRDSLEAAEIIHLTEQDSENPDVFIVKAYDGDYINGGIIGWDSEKECVRYFAGDPIRANQCEQEAVAEGSWAWEAGTAAILLNHLKGDVRAIMQEERERAMAEFDRKAS